MEIYEVCHQTMSNIFDFLNSGKNGGGFLCQFCTEKKQWQILNRSLLMKSCKQLGKYQCLKYGVNTHRFLLFPYQKSTTTLFPDILFWHPDSAESNCMSSVNEIFGYII